MAETIESFVAKLQAEGVQAGQTEAQRIREQAEKQAQQTVQQARQEAEKIIADAKAEAESIKERSETELALAGRDAVLRLRDTLSRAIQEVLQRQTQERLEDSNFLSQLIHDLILQYAQADSQGSEAMELNIAKKNREKLTDYALKEITEKSVNLEGTLNRAGFEYSVDNATVEVTTESIVDMLSGMVSPRLREVLDQATKQTDAKA